jgi:hypothetical protein
MMLHWKIRYLDRADKQFKDRNLYLDTKTLDLVTRAAVELVVENKAPETEREMLKYRRLFAEDTSGNGPGDWSNCDKGRSFSLLDYLEHEAGKELPPDEMAQIVTGSPTARLLPSGARKHDVEFILAEPKPVPVAGVSLSSEEIRILGYFVRDLQEMTGSSFMKDGLGTLHCGSSPTLETAATDDEIRSFVTIFRRLYMENEPANFRKAVAVFVKALGNDRHAKWASGVADEYKKHLDSVPEFRPFVQPGACTFSTKRLIDVYLYTRYAHQPDEKRQRQFSDCLKEVHGKRELLTWMFLTEIWTCGLEIGNAGRYIAGWFKVYCDHHGVTPDVLHSLRDEHAGLGAAEKDEERRDRLFREKADALAADLWEQHGRPQGGLTQFLAAARDQLSKRLRG